MINTIAQLSQKLNQLMTKTADEVGEQSGYEIRPARKWSAQLFFQTLVGTFLAKPQASIMNMCYTASLEGVTSSRNGLNKRFNERSANFLKAMLSETIKIQVGLAQPTGVDLLDRFDQIVISDSTIINLPAELADQFKGTSRERDHEGYAALKAHVGLDLLSGKLWGPFLGAGATHDNAGAIDFSNLPAGALVIRDLGFWDLGDWKARQERGIYTLSRLKHGSVLYARNGQRLELLPALEGAGSSRVELEVLLGLNEKIPVRVLATKVPEDVKLDRLKAHKIEEDDPGADWHGWTILVSDVPAAKLSLLEAYGLYRARWQIELLFKNWKQTGQVDEWQTKNPWRILCEIYAKLIALLISHWITVLSAWEEPERSTMGALQMIQLMGLTIIMFVREEKTLRIVLERIADGLFATAKLGKSKRKPSTAQILTNPDLALPNISTHSHLPPLQIYQSVSDLSLLG